MKFYLAGPVGYGIEGTVWKDEIKTVLRRFNHLVYDPIENDYRYPRVPEMNSLKSTPKNNWRKINVIMQDIFKDDCRFITECDYLICYFRGRALGTSGEQTLAYYLRRFLGKKVKTICVYAPDFVPDEWTLCCSDFVFFSISDCLKFLRKEFCSEIICYSG